MGALRPKLEARLGRYILERRLGAGGMAEVFLARAEGDSLSRVAIKRILPEFEDDERLVQMFGDEARIISRLSHPNIVRLLDVGEQSGELFIAMEYVDGAPCSSILRCAAERKTTMPLAGALFIAHEVLSALTVAHAACDDEGRNLHIVHRDVSPSNILVSRTGDVKLIDFGITRSRTNQRPSLPGELRGKLRYLAPEQVLGEELDARTDLYSLGVVLAELLLGRSLFKGNSDFEIVLRISRGEIPSLDDSGLPLPLITLLKVALAYRREDRFQGAEEFQRTLVTAASVLGARLDETELLPFVHALGVLSSTSGTRARTQIRIDGDSIVPSGTPTHPDGGARPRVPTLPTEPVPYRPVEVLPIPLDRAKRPPPLPASARPKRPTIDSLTPTAPSPQSLPTRNFDQKPVSIVTMPAEPMYRLRTKAGAVVGPVPRERALELLATGRINGRTRVSVDGIEYVRAEHVPSLTQAASRAVYQFAEPLSKHAEWATPLSRATLPSALYTLAIQRRTGMLVVRNGPRQKRIYIEHGDPVFIASTERSELLGHRLVASGMASTKVIEAALHHQPPLNLGASLVNLGVLTPPGLVRELAAQLEDRFVSVGSFKAGELLFLAGRKPEEEPVRTQKPTLHLITELVRTGYDAAEIAALLGPFASRPIARGSRYRTVATLMGFDVAEQAAFDCAVGAPSIQSLVAELGRQRTATMPETLRAIFLALSSGLLKVEGWPQACVRRLV